MLSAVIIQLMIRFRFAIPSGNCYRSKTNGIIYEISKYWYEKIHSPQANAPFCRKIERDEKIAIVVIENLLLLLVVINLS